jgi:hypothetical protein
MASRAVAGQGECSRRGNIACAREKRDGPSVCGELRQMSGRPQRGLQKPGLRALSGLLLLLTPFAKMPTSLFRRRRFWATRAFPPRSAAKRNRRERWGLFVEPSDSRSLILGLQWLGGPSCGGADVRNAARSLHGDDRVVNVQNGRQPGAQRLDCVIERRHPGFAVSGRSIRASGAAALSACDGQSERRGGTCFHRGEGWERLCRGGP